MLLIREEHQVIGKCEDAFEESLRDEWMPGIAAGDGARLLYYAHLAHGSGRSYRVVTYTLLRDAAAWGALVERVDGGDLARLSAKLDDLRHDVSAKQLVPLPWSMVQEIDFETVPTEAREHESSVFMEDTVWPFQGGLEAYIERAGAQYANDYDESFPDTPRLLEIQAAYRTAYGSHRRREIVLWQKLLRPEGLLTLLTEEIPDEYKKPGRWMLDALDFRDQWESRLLRTSSWSPLY
ncbi:MAG: hypothetical protein AAEJ53_15725 [Myxococcota bacterium]